MPNLNHLLTASFRNNLDLAGFEIHRRLTDAYPDKAVLATYDYDFDLIAFGVAGRCLLWDAQDMASLFLCEWRGREEGTHLVPLHSFLQIDWNCKHLQCLTTEIDNLKYNFILADTVDIARAFFESVCNFTTDADGRVIVFDGRFNRDPALEEGIKNTSLDDLMLAKDQIGYLRENVVSFFQSKELYQQFGVPWKRGALLHGPPGNGKTHAIKALVNEIGRPCIVVKSIRQKNISEEKSISRLFARARQIAPAIVVFEDIDSLVLRSSLSALLNEMDGFADNSGLLFLATTNHLDKLDPALAERPSRFDRKFEFPNMRKEERGRLLTSRFERMDPKMRPSASAIEQAVVATKGFSGAMMQELVRSCMMGWMVLQDGTTTDDLLATEISRLMPK